MKKFAWLMMASAVLLPACGDDDPDRARNGNGGDVGGEVAGTCSGVQSQITQRFNELMARVDRPCESDSDCILADPLEKFIADDDGQTGNDPGELCFSKCGFSILASEQGRWSDFVDDDDRLNQLCRRNLELECRVGQPSCSGRPVCINRVCHFEGNGDEPQPEPTFTTLPDPQPQPQPQPTQTPAQ